MSRLQALTNKLISAEDVFKMTDNGLSVFKREISDFSTIKNVKNVFLTKDNNPSCRIKQASSGLWYFYVYNDEGGCYNCIQFIQKRYKLSFKDAISYIISNKDNLTPVITEVQEKEPLFYDFTKQPYTQQHKDYYCIGGLTEEFLTNEMDIYAVKYININHTVKEVSKDQFVFAYAYRNILGHHMPGLLKLLHLGDNVDKSQKWKNNLLPFTFYYTHKIKPNTVVFVSKSNKDSAITQFCGITSIAAMSENYQNIKTGLENLIKLFPTNTFILNLGSDNQAITTRKALCKKFNLNYFETPQYLEKDGINDNFEYVKVFGMEKFKKLLKNKKLL